MINSKAQAEVIPIDHLWNSDSVESWERALLRYWQFVKKDNVALEQRMENLNVAYLAQLDSRGWYEFLEKEYFRWKFTANNRYATTTSQLRKYIADNTLDELHQIKLELISLDPTDISKGLSTAKRIHGLGCAGASGLLALLFPQHFGTVDQFAVKALRDVDGLPEANPLEKMNESSLSVKDGVVLIEIMKRHATRLNQCFGSTTWTPRKIDMILWTYGRPSDQTTDRANQQAGSTPVQPRGTKASRSDTAHDDSGLRNHEMFALAVAPYKGSILSSSDIGRLVLGAFPHFNPGSLRPNDHALGNKSPCGCAGTDRQVFNRIEFGKYLVL